MSNHQKIQCNVTECVHNCIEDSTCKLDKILVTYGKTNTDNNSSDETCCAMYSSIGNLNAREVSASKQV